MTTAMTGKRVLVTGACKSGLHAAQMLVSQGALVILTDRNHRRAAREARKMGITALRADLSCPSGVDGLAREMELLGGCDALIHIGQGTASELLTDDDHRAVWEADFLSAIRTARAMVPQMVRAGWGRVVFVTSDLPASAPHDALISFTRGVKVPYALKGVHFNALSPRQVAPLLRFLCEDHGTVH